MIVQRGYRQKRKRACARCSIQTCGDHIPFHIIRQYSDIVVRDRKRLISVCSCGASGTSHKVELEDSATPGNQQVNYLACRVPDPNIAPRPVSDLGDPEVQAEHAQNRARPSPPVTPHLTRRRVYANAEAARPSVKGDAYT